ncbi:hypothetical protein HDU76_009622 [Blyttiomyces sp. JEL0837]|nr:hypothetical protein HDU76_009622 [Blyttiomyces sp. JEL0837]
MAKERMQDTLAEFGPHWYKFDHVPYYEMDHISCTLKPLTKEDRIRRVTEMKSAVECLITMNEVMTKGGSQSLGMTQHPVMRKNFAPRFSIALLIMNSLQGLKPGHAGLDVKAALKLFCLKFGVIKQSMLQEIQFTIELLGPKVTATLWVHLGGAHWDPDSLEDGQLHEVGYLFEDAENEELGLEIGSVTQEEDAHGVRESSFVKKLSKLAAYGTSVSQAALLCLKTPTSSVIDVIEKLDELVMGGEKGGLTRQEAATVCYKLPSISAAEINAKIDELVKGGEKGGLERSQAVTICYMLPNASAAEINAKLDELVNGGIERSQAANIVRFAPDASVEALCGRVTRLHKELNIPFKMAASIAGSMAASRCLEKLINDTLAFASHFRCPISYAVHFCFRYYYLSLNKLIDVEKQIGGRWMIQVTPEEYTQHQSNMEVWVDDCESRSCPVVGCRYESKKHSVLSEHMLSHCEELWEFNCSKCDKKFRYRRDWMSTMTNAAKEEITAVNIQFGLRLKSLRFINP